MFGFLKRKRKPSVRTAVRREVKTARKASSPFLRRKTHIHSGKEFYDSLAWLALRYKVLLHYGPKCMCCGATPKDGAAIHVDHIKPKSKYPKLALSFRNMQVLCGECNIAKRNTDETDFRSLWQRFRALFIMV